MGLCSHSAYRSGGEYELKGADDIKNIKINS